VSKKEKLEVEILDVKEVTTYPKLDKPFVTNIITYRYADWAPRSLFIPKDEDTPENRAKLIREDIEAIKKAKPSTLSV
jgi:hypothetical protein